MIGIGARYLFIDKSARAHEVREYCVSPWNVGIVLEDFAISIYGED
jgi:hypothetical protein